jgi:hypothetical protein
MPDDSEGSANSGGAIMNVSVNAGQFLQKLTGGAVEEAGGLISDWLRYQRLKLTAGRLEGARKMCREAGINNPEEVSVSTLAPWLEGASIEDNSSLHEMWESLLANAADPRDDRIETHRSFVRILKQIEPPEQRVLKALYHIDSESGEKERGLTLLDSYPDDGKIINEIGVLAPSHDRLQLAKTNLIRLGLCVRGRNSAVVPEDENPPQPQEAPYAVHISDFGRAFYEACQPPNPTRSC